MIIHKEPHPRSGKLVRLRRAIKTIPRLEEGALLEVEDWHDRVAGRSWMLCDGNPAAMIYGMRSGHLPTDNEVVYAKTDGLGRLLHVSEFEDFQK